MTKTGKAAAIVLAAGKGNRMKSDLPKVLHKIGGRPMIRIIMDTLVSLHLDRVVVVVGHQGEMVEQALADYDVDIVWQRERLGTGHAVMMTSEVLADFDGTTLVALGDVPFLSGESIQKLFRVHAQAGAAATCLSAILDDPAGYGRIVRDNTGDRLREIVEDKDASQEIRSIREINSGTFCFDNLALFESLSKIDNRNAQAEYYLTDTIKILNEKGLCVAVAVADNPDELRGVNSVEQLSLLERKFASRL